MQTNFQNRTKKKSRNQRSNYINNDREQSNSRTSRKDETHNTDQGDLSSIFGTLQSMMSNESGQKKIQNLLSQFLGDDKDDENVKDVEENFEDDQNYENDIKNNSGASSNFSEIIGNLLGGGKSSFDPNLLNKAQKLCSGMKNDNKHFKLLSSIRPYLSCKRQQNLDKAKEILKLIQILKLTKFQKT